MKLLGLAASNSRRSINGQLIAHAADIFTTEIEPGAAAEILDLNDYEMPIYSIDRQNEGGIPAPAQRFRDRIAAADAVILSFAEHNGTYSVAYKNLFDWASRIDRNIYQDRPAVLFSTSPGGRGGAGVLDVALRAAPRFGMDVRAHLAVPSFNDVFTDGKCVDPETSRAIRAALQSLKG